MLKSLAYCFTLVLKSANKALIKAQITTNKQSRQYLDYFTFSEENVSCASVMLKSLAYCFFLLVLESTNKLLVHISPQLKEHNSSTHLQN